MQISGPSDPSKKPPTPPPRKESLPLSSPSSQKAANILLKENRASAPVEVGKAVVIKDLSQTKDISRLWERLQDLSKQSDVQSIQIQGVGTFKRDQILQLLGLRTPLIPHRIPILLNILDRVGMENPSFSQIEELVISGRDELRSSLVASFIKQDPKISVQNLHQAALWAASFGDLPTLKILLQAIREKRGEPLGDSLPLTPLHAAIINRHHEVARFLAQQGARLNQPDPQGLPPLHLAAENSDRAMIEILLLENADINQRDAEGKTPIFKAVERGHEGWIKYLLLKSPNVLWPDREKRTPLLVAVKSGLERVVEPLISKGANVNEGDRAGHRPLIEAVKAGNAAIVEQLIAAKARVDDRDDNGRSALFWAASLGHTALVKLLIENHADVRQKDADGKSVLREASDKGHQSIVALLIDAGAPREDIVPKAVKDFDAFCEKQSEEFAAKLLNEMERSPAPADIFKRGYQTFLNSMEVEAKRLGIPEDVVKSYRWQAFALGDLFRKAPGDIKSKLRLSVSQQVSQLQIGLKSLEKPPMDIHELLLRLQALCVAKRVTDPKFQMSTKEMGIPDSIIPVSERRTALSQSWLLEGFQNVYDQVQNRVLIRDRPYRLVSIETENFLDEPLASVGSSNLRELLLFDPHNCPHLDQAYQELKKRILEKNKPLTTLQMLEMVKDTTRAIFPWDENTTEKKVDDFIDNKKSKKQNLVQGASDTIVAIDIDEFVKEKIGVCRHHGLLTAYLVSRLTRELGGRVVPKGVVKQMRFNIPDGSHAWTLFISEQGKLIHFDSLWNVLIPINDEKTRKLLGELGYGSNPIQWQYRIGCEVAERMNYG